MLLFLDTLFFALFSVKLFRRLRTLFWTQTRPQSGANVHTVLSIFIIHKTKFISRSKEVGFSRVVFKYKGFWLLSGPRVHVILSTTQEICSEGHGVLVYGQFGWE